MQAGFLVRVVAVVFVLMLGIGRAGAAEPITIGFGMALTGNIAANGRAALIAMKLWEGGYQQGGRPFGAAGETGLLRRPEHPALDVPGIYTKLLDVDKVDLVISGYGTNVTVPAMPVVMEHKRLFMTLFALGVNSEFKYSRFFGMLPAGPSAERAAGILEGVLRHGDVDAAAGEDAGDRRRRMPNCHAMRSRAHWTMPRDRSEGDIQPVLSADDQRFLADRAGDSGEPIPTSFISLLPR